MFMFCSVGNLNPHNAKINGRLKKKLAQSRHIKRHSKLSTISRGFSLHPIYLFTPPSRRHYHSARYLLHTYSTTLQFMCEKIKPSPCILQEQRDDWYLNHCFSLRKLAPNLSASTPVSPLMPVILSGLMCLLIAWIQALQRSWDSQPGI